MSKDYLRLKLPETGVVDFSLQMEKGAAWQVAEHWAQGPYAPAAEAASIRLAVTIWLQVALLYVTTCVAILLLYRPLYVCVCRDR